jgi:hypothetical protein
MTEFDENDVTIEHVKLARGVGSLRLTHRPTGLFVDAHLNSEPVIPKKHALMHDLREKFLALRGDERG